MCPLGWLACPLVATLSVGQGSPSQPVSPATPSSQDIPRFEISAGYEPRHDRFRYRFENDSSFDTPFLVPHFFVQSYKADNRWLTGRARFQLAGLHWTSEASLAPSITTFADDFDTFFQPDGDVVTSGTAGDVRLRSWGFAQTLRRPLRPRSGAEARLWLRVGYHFRRDQADFLPADRVVTHTRPVAENRTPISTRETTRSHVHQVSFGAQLAQSVGKGWHIELDGDVAPTTRARLSTRLPDKYPGRDIVFTAIAFDASGHVSLSRNWPRWLVEVAAGASRSGSYVTARQFRWDGAAIRLSVGVRP